MDKVAEISTKYQESFQFLQARKKRQVNQLVLLNNLQRGDQNIASTMILTLFNRTLSSLYDDKLQIKFLPSQNISQEQINAFNLLAQSDFLEMDKSRLDYDWCWDTLFFGRGFMETLRFNKKRKIMEPCVINPLAMGYDPYFNDSKQWRYYWKWITKSRWEVVKLIEKGIITGIKKPEEIADGVDPYLWEYKVKRDQAREGTPPSPDAHGGDVYQILEYFGYDDKGKKCVFWTDRDISKILMKEDLELDDDEGFDDWPIVVKESYREPHSSIPFSVADILDDKHRAKSVLLNLAFIAAKDQANPVYLYNSEKVDDVTQFLARQVNQHIPVNDVMGAVQPLNKNATMSPDLLNFINVITQEANEPLGTGTALQPSQTMATQTATEISIEQQLNDMAQSLVSKVMQFGEKQFWSHWFHLYSKNAKDLGTKMANIVGVKGVEGTEIDMKMFVTKYPPGVLVYSAKEADYKELVLRRDLMQLYPALVQTLDEDGVRNFNKHVFFPKFLQDPSLIDVMLPKTIDEMKAEAENEQLKDNQMPDVAETDNHTAHIYTHHMVQPKTWAVWYHIAWHQDSLEKKKMQEMQMQQMQMQQAQSGQEQQGPPSALGGKGEVGVEKQSPMAQATPLKTEMKNV